MKKVIGFCFAVALFASCSDDDSSSVDFDQLEGKWYPVSYKYNGDTYEYEHEPCAKDYIEFAANDVYKTYQVWECAGSEVIDSEAGSGTYSTDGDKVTVAIDGDTNTVTVKKLTGNTLQVSYKEDVDEDDDLETITEVYSGTP